MKNTSEKVHLYLFRAMKFAFRQWRNSHAQPWTQKLKAGEPKWLSLQIISPLWGCHPVHEYCKAREAVLCYIDTFSPNSLCLTFQTLKTIFQHCSGGDSSTSHQTKATQKQQPGRHINRNTSRATSPVIPTTTSWKEVETTYGISNRFQPLKLDLPVFVSQYPNFIENRYDAKPRDMSWGFIQLFS